MHSNAARVIIILADLTPKRASTLHESTHSLKSCPVSGSAGIGGSFGSTLPVANSDGLTRPMTSCSVFVCIVLQSKGKDKQSKPRYKKERNKWMVLAT
eukprot:5767589-Amphidinium_carterae.1